MTLEYVYIFKNEEILVKFQIFNLKDSFSNEVCVIIVSKYEVRRKSGTGNDFYFTTTNSAIATRTDSVTCRPIIGKLRFFRTQRAH